MQEIVLKATTSLSDLRSWRIVPGEPVRFEVPRRFEFDPSAEGPAASFLASCREAKCQILVRCLEVISTPIVPASFPEVLNSFLSVFGIQLLLTATTLVDPAGRDLLGSVVVAVQSRLLECRGRVELSDRVYIISTDPDDPIPRSLRIGNELTFPRYAMFRTCIAYAAQRLFGSIDPLSSNLEDALATVLYEVASNSWHHGREGTHLEPLEGTRGILIHRLSLPAYGLAKRPAGMPTPIGDFLVREAANDAGPLRVLSLTVTDVGIGIHRTLPPLKGETAADTFLRAFRTGESALPRGEGTQRGLGLPKVLGHSKAIRASLTIQSAELVAHADLSDEQSAGDDNAFVFDAPLVGWTRGCSLTATWIDRQQSRSPQLPLGFEGKE